ncbi:hypothetical protein [Methanobacterium formicicum]|uniref:hypothetical protein n=1 Tax=Methanobacterium formicicum TaxID=2162 RepID=UPI0024932A46|nr:hypothetical protein [Methanobacterium formicicum]
MHSYGASGVYSRVCTVSPVALMLLYGTGLIIKGGVITALPTSEAVRAGGPSTG